MADCCSVQAKNRQERQLLWVVLGLNAIMFVVEFTAGWLAGSSGLLADSLDMLADALVYSLSLYAVGRGVSQKAKAALLNGSLQMVLGLSVLGHVAWRAFVGSVPNAEVMGSVAVLALAVNAACFLLLFKFRRGDINMRASWICSRNDILANIGVLVAAGLVTWVGSPWPDLVIGALIAAIVIHSSWKIIVGASHSLRTGQTQTSDGCGN
jgi:Co/Zn/Cd efflux system component